MTANEWLVANGKKPYNVDFFWYWGTIADYNPHDPGNEPDEQDFLLPDEVFKALPGRVTYPNVKRYETHKEAMSAFELAYERVLV